jgi:hypothetical protein
MNTRRLSIAVLAAALCACVSTPVFAHNQPTSYAVRTVTVSSAGDLRIERGMDKSDVSWIMRNKTRQSLARNVWAFNGFVANYEPANQQGCETLVLTFTQDKLSDIKLVNSSSLAVIVARLKSGPVSARLVSQ